MKNKGHIHADLMAQYAEDAKTHAEPWRLWEFECWKDNWRMLGHHPSWDISTKYRRKPKTHIVNGAEVPDLRFDPDSGQQYWYPDPCIEALVSHSIRKSTSDNHRAANNLCYEPTEEGKQAAFIHALAWLGIEY